MRAAPPQRPRVGISACLLGEKVRYDGGHKLDTFLLHGLGQVVDFLPVCPEVECGLPIPRPAMHLVGDPQRPRLISPKDGSDHTQRMLAWAARRLEGLAPLNLSGFIFKSHSPSSGMERVRVYNEQGDVISRAGRGLFARAWQERFPLLPCEEEGRLHDPELRRNFITRLFAYTRWQALRATSPGVGDLVGFHARHKYLLMAHGPTGLRALGKLVAAARPETLSDALEGYATEFMSTLRHPATIKKNHNVLLHLAGYFKKSLDDWEKRELHDLIAAYARGELPLLAPQTLLLHFIRRHRLTYLSDQYWLEPHPLEWRLQQATLSIP